MLSSNHEFKKQEHPSKRRNTMKKTLLVALMLLIAGSAFAAPTKLVKCKVDGKVKRVESVKACEDLKGTVIEPKAAKKI